MKIPQFPLHLLKRRSRKGYTLMELIVVIAILAIGFGSAISALISGTTSMNKVSIQTTDRYVAMMVTQSIEQSIRYASIVTIYDPTQTTQTSDQPNRIRTLNGRVLSKLGSGKEVALTGQENLPSTYSVILTMTQTSEKTVGVSITVSDTARDTVKYPPSTFTTSIAIQNLPNSDQVMIFPAYDTKWTYSAIAYQLP